MKLGLFVFLFTLSTLLFSLEKSPSDVYAESMVLKKMVIELRNENGITAKLPFVEVQKGKLPRHVLQKTLEVLTKVNKYREIHNYGEITVPPVPPRDITPQDVYNNVKRLKVEVAYLLKDRSILSQKRFKQHLFKDKTPSDVYRVLWSVSLGFDKLLGQGFTPTDVYAQTQEIVERIKFLRSTQRENKVVEMPVLLKNQHPNHALYKSVGLIKKLCQAERKLWMKPVPIPKIPHKIISPTEVYDSLQTVNAELNRISRRLGVERSFEIKNMPTKKTPSDVVQNLEYAIALLPDFDFSRKLNQFPKSSLVKTPNDVYAVSEFILDKIKKIKLQKGIHVKANETSYIYGLKPIHVYVKGVEDLEKVAKLKKLEGFKPSESPGPPTTKITPSEVYELILRLDNEINLIYKGKGIIPYRESLNKRQYSDKTSSDVYDVLWKISYELDTMLNQDYTPNETYILAKKIQNDVSAISKYFLKKNIKLKVKTIASKRPEDVFNESLVLLDKLQLVKNRGNMKSVKTAIPKDKLITPTSVYNALRIISATVTEIHVYFGIYSQDTMKITADNKTPSDVYGVVELTNRILTTVLEDNSYEN